MEIMKRMAKKAQCLRGEKIPTIAFFGDSVTQGCFELYQKNESEVETYFDKECAYHNYFAKICGVDTTELLANKINHPTRDLNWLFAFSLIDTMMQ